MRRQGCCSACAAACLLSLRRCLLGHPVAKLTHALLPCTRSLPGWLQEEEEWQALLAEVEQLDQQQLTAAGAAPEGKHAGSGAAAAADADTAAAGEGAAEAEEQPCGDGGELAALQQVHGDLHRHLAMQVEGVCKLVGDVEEMVERANSSAQAMQVRVAGRELLPAWHVHQQQLEGSSSSSSSRTHHSVHWQCSRRQRSLPPAH